MLSILLICCAWGVYAEEIFPPHCTPFVVETELVKLPATQSTVTMIHNLSSGDLWVTHSVAEAGASWSSHLQAGNWSALVLPEKPFELSCIESIPGHEQQVSCAGVLAVCQWAAATLPKKPSDTPWAAEDMLLSPLIAYIRRQGFVLTPTAQ
ncbi:MAG TPA: hypothetical protein DDY37_01815 [Legionella sp.]|nr:hypothetical protein [Legionella sp.]